MRRAINKHAWGSLVEEPISLPIKRSRGVATGSTKRPSPRHALTSLANSSASPPALHMECAATSTSTRAHHDYSDEGSLIAPLGTKKTVAQSMSGNAVCKPHFVQRKT